MVGKSAEVKKGRSLNDLRNMIPVTVDRIVQTKRFGRQTEIVVLKFELFGEKEEEARQIFGVYRSAVQAENESLAREAEAKFLALTHFSAAEVDKKRQERWAELGQKVHGTS